MCQIHQILNRLLFDIMDIGPSYHWIASCLRRLCIKAHILRSVELTVPIVTGKIKSTF